MFFVNEKETIGFTGSFRPVKIKIRRRIPLLPGWYLVNKKPKNKTLVINRYADLKYLDYDDVYEYRKKLLIRYSKLIERGRRKIGSIKVIQASELWNHLAEDWVYVLVLGRRSMFMFMGNYDFLSYYFSYKRRIVNRKNDGLVVVANDGDLRVSFLVVDGRRVKIPFYDLFKLNYEKWLAYKSVGSMPLVLAISFWYAGARADNLFDEETRLFKELKWIERVLGEGS